MTSVTFFSKKQTAVLPPLTVDMHELKGCLPKPNESISIEQMNQTIAQRTANF